MANGIGTATLNFGSFPGTSEASVAVTGQTAISASSTVEAFVMANDTSGSHTASDHRYFAALVGLTCGTPTAGVGFTIYGRCLDDMQGSFLIHWVWTD